MKYSINGTGNIVAERDIYSLGGFIPKGRIGGKIASEAQLSQDGECWLAGGDISTRPDIVIKDNAYIGDFFINEQAIHTDGITEFSGNTLIPGYITVRCLQADPKNNVFIKDSFIGVSMDVLCGPATGANFPFEPGRYNQDAPKGTLFTSATMKVAAGNYVRNTTTLRIGKDTYVYTPAGYNARIYWAYVDASGQLAYAGETEVCSKALYKLSHPVYKVCMIAYALNPTLTPAQLGVSGAKILGHISGSLLMDLRPESASGQYVIDNSSFIMNTDNFGLATTQVRFLAGGMYDTTMYTKTDRQDYKPYGTFRNVERLEYDQDIADAFRTNVNRDTFISGFDCPLLRISEGTFNNSLAGKGDLVLRRCIVPKAEFQDDVINGNVYEDIDFSYANEALGTVMTGYTRFISSHKQGIYRMSGGPSSVGFISHKGNLSDTARLYQAEVYLPLDGSIMEQGSYGTGQLDSYYENAKSDNPIRIRTGKPIATFGLALPSLPAGYSVKALYYLDEDFIIRSIIMDPTELVNTYPYVVMLFRKEDDSALNVTDFIALNRTLRIIDHSKAPEITGSAYVGAGCMVRGDVQLHGDPYVNRLLDVNLWEWGSVDEGQLINGWAAAKTLSGSSTEVDRRRFKELIPVEPGAEITCNSGYWVRCYFFDYEGNYISTPGWGQTANTAPANAAFAGVALKKGAAYTDNLYIEDSDIPLANVKYLRAFENRRYITNELDRTSPKDVFLTEDQWMVAAVSTAAGSVGKLYKGLISTSNKWCILKRPFNMGSSWTIQLGNSVTYTANYASWDALTKLLGSGIKDGAALTGLELKKKDDNIVTLLDVLAARFMVKFVPSPRIVVPYGSSTLSISGPKIRMYDNAVLSRNLNQQGEIVLSGDAVMGYDFNSGSCMCSNGHSDAIIKLP